MTDPEDVTELQRADRVEVEVDEAPDTERPHPIEADDADVAEQRADLGDNDDPRDAEPDPRF